jgi:hypothetical protein
VRACGNNSNLAQCSAPSRLSSWIVERPSDKQAAKASWLAAVRASLLGAIPAAIVGPAFPDVCSGTGALAVPLRGAPERYSKAKLTLKTRAFSYEGVVDKDKIALECLPAS